MMETINFMVLFTLIFSLPACLPELQAANPEAVGEVAWGRDLKAALASAKSTGKPIFLLFQEVPGCAGCKQFGREVLSDEKVVAGIERNFIPLLVPNNSSGEDAEILERFSEPAWNYQVVRFLDSKGMDLIPRKDRVWQAPELLTRMSLALKKAGPPQPLVGAIQQVAIAQYCFWEGEMKIGAIDGVRRTEAGFISGKEVTLVDFDPSVISLETLNRKAEAAGVATQVFASLNGYKKAPASDQKRQLLGTKYAKLALTPEQATKVNAFARVSTDHADTFLPK